ncbi:MAG TPA: hypothetical protein VMH04_06660 [Candidatus Solibacter sp.]|nr:hypothetical protein [Candidatus Solibacter sp.]
MDDRQGNGNTEEDWIVKYRAALQAVPVRKSRSERLRGAFHNAFLGVAHVAGGFVRVFRAKPKSKLPKGTVIHQQQIPWRKKAEPLGAGEGGSKKVG